MLVQCYLLLLLPIAVVCCPLLLSLLPVVALCCLLPLYIAVVVAVAQMRLRSFTLQMEGELGRFHTQNVILEQRIEQEGEKLRAAENELHRERRKVRAMIRRSHLMASSIFFSLFPSCPSLFQSSNRT